MVEKRYYCRICGGTGRVELKEGVITLCKRCGGKGFTFAGQTIEAQAKPSIAKPEAGKTMPSKPEARKRKK